jgi:FkbM family methyltransferase
MIRNVMSATRRRGFLKATAYHMVSQRFVVQSPLLSRILWALFFGNRFLPALGRYASYADGSIDKDLKTIFQKKRSGFFVEIGSNDGVSGSNCKKLEMEQGWVGILVEPYLPNLNTSKLHRSRKNSFVHAAAVPADFGADTVELIFSNLMTLVDKPTSEISDPWRHALSGSEFLKPWESVERFSAPALSLNSILASQNAPREIELLSIDIEGFELDVLSDLDFNNYKFQAIILENRNRQAAVEFFRPLGYSLFSQPSPLNLIFTPTPR